MEQDILLVLQGVLDPNQDTRTQAESMLEQGSKQPGFAMALLTVALHSTTPLGTRQLATVLLKKHIKEHWSSEGMYFIEPAITDEEKAQIRATLPNGLSDNQSAIRTAISMAIATVAGFDCPHAWPELVPGLVSAISQKINVDLLAGAVTCFGMFIDELNDEQVMAVAPAMLPEMLNIAAAEECGPELRSDAIGIFRSIIDMLEMLAKEEKKNEVFAFLTPVLGPWLQLFTAILSTPITQQDAPNWGLKTRCLACLVRLVPPFGKLAAPHLPPVMAACWQMFNNCLPLYTELEVLRNAEDADDNEDDSSSVGLSTLVSELFEFVLTLVASPKFRPHVSGSLAEMMYITVGYMQMTGAQTERWSEDANALISEGDNDFSTVRASGEMLADEVLEALPKPGREALAIALHRRLHESSEAQRAGHPDWWRMREAVLSILGAVADRIPRNPPSSSLSAPTPGSAAAGGSSQGRPSSSSSQQQQQSLDMSTLVVPLLQECLNGGGNGSQASPFVIGRALWLVSKVSPRLPDELRPVILQAAATALAPNNPPAVRIGGCQAAAMLCPTVPTAVVQSVAEPLFAGLVAILNEGEEETLHLALEALMAVVKADSEAISRWEPSITPPVLKVWVDNVNDPLLAEDAEDLLRTMAKNAAILPAMLARMVPTIQDVLTNPNAHTSLLVSGCLDLSAALLSGCDVKTGSVNALSSTLTQPVMALLASSDDNEVVSAATAYLRTLIQVGGVEALGADAPSAVQGLTQAAIHLLTSENVTDSAACNAGGLVREMLRTLSPLLGPQATGELLRAVALRLGRAEEPTIIQGLISCLAFAVTLDARGVVDCLSAGDGQPLVVGLRRWTEQQVEIRTGYDIRSTTCALGTLLTLDHPALDKVTVRGRRLDEGGGIRTRSRSTKQQERWSEVLLRVKIVCLLVDAYIESDVQNAQMVGNALPSDEEEWDEDDDDQDDNNTTAGDDDDNDDDNIIPYFGVESLGGWDSSSDDLDLGLLDPLEAERRKTDPLSEMDVGGYAAQVLRAVAQQAPELMQSVAGELSPTQLAAASKVVNGS